MKKLHIFGTPYEPQSESVEFNGHSVRVHEFMDEEYFEHITLPMREMSIPDNDDAVGVARYNRAFNLRLIALSLKPSLMADMDDILQSLNAEPIKAIEKLLDAAMQVNGLNQAKNSPTTSSESA